MSSRNSVAAVSLTLLVAGLVLVAAKPASAVAPAGKHYAGTLVLPDSEMLSIDAAPGCLSFGKNEVCNEANDCGPWRFVEKQGRQNQWTMELQFENAVGMTVEVEGRGITERRGPKSSIAMTFVATVEEVRVNGTFAGSAISRSRCLDFGTSDD
jgi:hypothetical protein